MVEPVTGMMIAGGVMGMAGSLMEGRQAMRAARFNAATQRMMAGWERERSVNEQRIINLQGRKAVGQMRVNYAKSGVQIEGSAFDVLEESAIRVKEDEINERVEGERRAIAQERGAQLSMQQGRAAQTLSYFKAGSAGLNAAAGAME